MPQKIVADAVHDSDDTLVCFHCVLLFAESLVSFLVVMW